MTEVEGLWEQKDDNQETRRIEQVSRGNQWATYATGAVLAPMVVVLPFSTFVNTGQIAQMTKSEVITSAISWAFSPSWPSWRLFDEKPGEISP